jgi:putative membrane protein insertion efficiency factor
LKFRAQNSTQSLHAMTAPRISDAKQNVAQLLARAMLKAYQLTLSPLIGSDCRHLPTCSHYADEALARHGFWAGGWMTLARLLRCQPFGTSGLDFVPAEPPSGARWYLPWRYGRWRGTNSQPSP